MFAKKDADPAVAYEPTAERSRAQQMPSIISDGVEIVGDMIGETEVQVDGTVRGNLKAKRVMVGRTGTVDGSIKAETATIAGTVAGDITADNVTLESSARIKGGISVRGDMSMAAGARLEGKVSMKHNAGMTNEEKQASKPNGNAKPNGPVAANKVAASGSSMGRPAA